MVLLYYLPFAICSAVCATISATVLLLSRNRERSISLPLTAVNGYEDQEVLVEKDDPFDLTNPEDLIDGVPIDEDQFWANIRRRKLVMGAMFFLLVVVEAFSMGATAYMESSASRIAAFALHLYLAIYLLTVCVCSLGDQLVSSHWAAIIHVSILTTLATVLNGISVGLPHVDVDASVRDVNLPSIVDWSQLVSLVLYAATTAIASTTSRGPPLYFRPDNLYSKNIVEDVHKASVSGEVQSSVVGFLLYSFITPVVLLGYTSKSLEIRDLPIVPANMRATALYAKMRTALSDGKLNRDPRSRNGWSLLWKTLRVNGATLGITLTLTAFSGSLYYIPTIFLQRLLAYLESDPYRENTSWGWVYCAGLVVSNWFLWIVTVQLWGICTTVLQSRIKAQLNTTLFAKTLVRKDVASSMPSTTSGAVSPEGQGADEPTAQGVDDSNEDDFSSKAQIMTLMTTDVDRVSEFPKHLYTCAGGPVEILVASLILYYLLGVSSLLGLAAAIVFIPLTQFASQRVVNAQESLMKSRDERMSLMNELLGAIRMVKFMAWERRSEQKVMDIRRRELHYQRRNYTIETLLRGLWLAPPIAITLVAFFHFSVIRGQTLTPSIAFTSISLFNDLRYALSQLPETLISMIQSLVSVRRIEKYLNSEEVSLALTSSEELQTLISLTSVTIAWPRDRSGWSSALPSTASTPRAGFSLIDLTLRFPPGKLSLVCGRLGSGKTLLLLALLGEADVLSGQLVCPRTPPDTLATSSALPSIPDDEWVIPGTVAYVPQQAWLRNASIRDNILFSLPLSETRYKKTLEACALIPDLAALEDGDLAEIGERGVNLSGGQKARISLARAIYSRGSVLLLDDILSAVDAHTAHHLYEHCSKGDLLAERTVVLVSHHVQLCLPAAQYLVVLDNGKLQYAGTPHDSILSGVIGGLALGSPLHDKEENPKPEVLKQAGDNDIAAVPPNGDHEAESGAGISESPAECPDSNVRKPPKKFIEEESRAVGNIAPKVWLSYVQACGGYVYWILFVTMIFLGASIPVAQNGWLRYWSSAAEDSGSRHTALFYLGIFTAINVVGLVIQMLRLYVLYAGSINASTRLYERLLEAVLFARIRFHDTVSRGRVLNRFGKDFEGLDSTLADNFGQTLFCSVNIVTTLVVVAIVGGIGFLFAAIALGFFYYNVAKLYRIVARDMRRLDSVSRSPLYTTYGDTINGGVPVLRAFGGSTQILRDMIQQVDTNINPYYWMWSVNRWQQLRYNLLSSVITGVTGVVVLLNADVNAAFAGFTLAFASTLTDDMMAMVSRFVGLEQSMVALERVNEYSELEPEAKEFVEPRPPASWPEKGAIEVANLVIRYAPDLPDVLHDVSFSVKAQSKIGIIGRTGCGKSTLALSFFRFVEPKSGSILIDGVDIGKIGLTDLRSRITIIPQDPTIFAGTLRSALDVFDEYEDRELFEALERVHLLPPHELSVDETFTTHENIFRNLDSPIAEGGANLSAGEKQLICMARAILRKTKIVLMDEATASVDYATDELIGKTMREEFAASTVLTIAHRLRTVIDYDKVLLLEEGRVVEYDTPRVLLADPSSMFSALCQSTGPAEFALLKRRALET